MRFELPLLLWLAPVAAGLIALGAVFARRRRVGLARAWSPDLARLAARGARSSVLLLAVAALFAAVGAAGPRGGRFERTASGSGLNVVLAVDVSRSMLAEDVEPNRLRRVIGESRRLVQDLRQDRIGVLAFAGQSYVLSPLTLDHGAVLLYLETLDPDIASAGGTNLQAVLRQGLQALEHAVEGGDRALVVFTDGEGHDSIAGQLGVARDLARAGIRLILVAQGGTGPARIPIRDATGAFVEWKRDADGAIVETVRDDGTLRRLAEAAGGIFIGADLPDQAGAIRDELRALSRRPISERRLADLTPLAWVAALVAVGALAIQTGTRRSAALASLALALLSFDVAAQRQASPDPPALRAAGRAAGDTAWYNAGTAALAAGRLTDARALLERAARTLDPGLRYRALYNLGLAAFLAARDDSTAREAQLTDAVDRFKQALLLDPASLDAKWNLELALREQPPSSGGGTPPPTGSGAGEETPRDGGLSPAEAEAILQSVERSEAATRAGVVRRQRLRTATALKDW